MEIEDAKKRQGALLRKTRQETQKLCKEKRCAIVECLLQPLCINYIYLPRSGSCLLRVLWSYNASLSYRCKELEAVRLKRNESKMKYEFERKLDRYAKHEAVLRRKVSLY